MAEYKIVHYRENGKDFFQNWLDSLRDYRGRKAVQNAVDRTEDGKMVISAFIVFVAMMSGN